MVRGVKPAPPVAARPPAFPGNEGELAVLARQVMRLIHEQAAQPGRTERSEESLAAVARLLYQGRRGRERHLAPDLFGEPAWDMLLDLYISHVLGRTVSTSSLSIASSVPPTTALRWINQLCNHGLARKRAHHTDARVTLVELTPLGHRAMRACLAEIAQAIAL